ncbi:SET domain-containing protein [Xylariales sp. AK1849]|nr:SET domain-containing protein [Xylariales sp. AK1849]
MRRGEFSLNALPAWCAFNDVNFIDVNVADVEGRGYGLVAERGLRNDHDNVEVPTLLTIPKDLVLSAEAVDEYAKVDKNFRDLLEATGHQSHRGDILLFLLVQLILSSPDYTGPKGVHSPWTQYFSLLPAQVPVPTMWTESEVSHLRGTSLESAVAAKLSALTKEFDELRAKCDDIPFWYDILCAEELVTIHDWVLLDALYRSRSLDLPRSGESMVPCLDLVNHSRAASAYFEEDQKDQVALLLRTGSAVLAGSEITIDYGQGKSAAEMLFSYGFIDADTPASSIVLPLEALDDDPLAKAKLHVFGATPTLRIEDAEDGIPNWAAPFIYLLCLNEEDGIRFGLLQEIDGTRHLKLYWQEEDVTDKAGEFENLISGHDLCPVFHLRAITVILETIQQQVGSLEAHHDTSRISGLARAEILQTALQLREAELDLLQRSLQALENQRDKLLEDDTVLAYLGSMEEAQNDEISSQLSNDEEEDFS